jgi:hypothetical protein
MNNDYLGLFYQVIDLEVISLGDGQWHSIRDFRRDSPTDRSDAGNSNGGTRQDMRENGTATHCSHEFSPCPNVFERCGRHDIVERSRVAPAQHVKLCSTFCIEARQTYIHLNSNRLVDQSGDSSASVRVFSYQLARKASASYGRSPSGSSGLWFL